MSFKLPAGQHFGAISKSYDLAGFTLTKTAYSPNLKLSKHAHELACFCLVLHGSYVESYGKTTLDCQPSSLLFRPPGELHTDHFHNAGSVCFLIEVNADWLDCIREHTATFDSPTAIRQSSAAWLAMKAYEEFNHLDEVSPLAVQGLTLAIAAELARAPIKVAPNAAPRWLQQVKEILHAHFSENLTLASIAETVGVHPVYLAAAFRKCYRCTIGDYVRQLRVAYACRALLNSDVPLVEIALSAGFSSQSHFSRTFKQLTGISPAQYRACRKSS
jgi:AraC family transcriptional regulator